MPKKLITLKLPPGIVKDWTDYSTEGRYNNGERVRFREDLPEKIGGWTATSIYDVQGVPRTIHAWRDLLENNIVAVGTHSHIYVIHSGAVYDITPLRKTSTNVNNCFTTVDESTTVTVADSTHEAQTGDWITIGSAAAVGGITPSGNYEVTVVDSNSYTIVHSSEATSSVSGGGGSATDIEYAVTSGFASTAGGLGWGAGTWGMTGTTWGTARATSAAVVAETTYWSLDNWGEDLIACQRNGKIYLWDASAGVGTRATVLSNAPVTNKIVSIASEQRHVVAYGAYDGTANNPMNVAWSDQATNNTWTATATNTAGDFLLTRGTRIVAQMRTRTQTLIWTDTSLYGQSYSGKPYIFTFNLLAEDTTIMGQNSSIDVDGTVFWIGTDNFYVYNGQVQVLNAPVRRHVFDNMNSDAASKCFVGVNKKFQEVWFFYPRGVEVEPSHYAAYYYGAPQKNIWHIGALDRTCWQDAEKFVNTPIAYSSGGNYYDHEIGHNDGSSAMNPSLETGILELTTESGEGGNLMLVDKLIPDAVTGGIIKVEILTQKYPQLGSGISETSKGPFDIAATDSKISFRAKGRQVRLKWSDTGTGYGWRIGTPRIRIAPMGRR